MGQERLSVDGHDLAKKFCAAQIMPCNSIFTSFVGLLKKYCKITSCAIKITHNKK